jgi:L-serine dehydratase
MGGEFQRIKVHFDLNGSLPTTYLSQGSDMGLCAGLMGFEADDERLVEYKREMQKNNLTIEYVNGVFGDPHPNTYNLTLYNGEEEHFLSALSIGGGIIEVKKIDGLAVSFYGDCYGLVIWGKEMPASLLELLNNYGCRVAGSEDIEPSLLFASSLTPFDENLLSAISDFQSVTATQIISPVLPILSIADMGLPFSNALEMERYGSEQGIADLADLALAYECARGGLSQREVMLKASQVIEITEQSIHQGLRGTEYGDRILGVQSNKYSARQQQGGMLNLGVLDAIIPNVTALMEVKSAMGVIVAAPTAGSCGGLPGTIMAVGEAQGLDRQARARGLLAAGVVGVLIATRSTFSAEICGCQAECGVSSGMIAAAVVSMMGGDFQSSMAAASMALQNIFGMVCDPVANRVEVPCLGKNILAAGNGVSCANLAMAGFDHVIPFDEVVDAMDKVGRALPHELRCTALGGLSITPASKIITTKLESSNGC